MSDFKNKKFAYKRIKTQYQIDQSGKIEQTNKDTLLCLSNSNWDTILIKAKTKRSLQEIFRRNGQIRNFVLFTFSAGLALLIKRNIKISQILIDTEYPGKDAIVKNIILEILKEETMLPDLHFGFVGKLSPAHLLAKQIVIGRKNASLILSEAHLLKAIKKTEVGKQLKDT